MHVLQLAVQHLGVATAPHAIGKLSPQEISDEDDTSRQADFIHEYEALCRKHGLIVVCASHHATDNPELAAPAPEQDAGPSGLPTIAEHIASLRRGQDWTLIQRRDKVVGG